MTLSAFKISSCCDCRLERRFSRIRRNRSSRAASCCLAASASVCWGAPSPASAPASAPAGVADSPSAVSALVGASVTEILAAGASVVVGASVVAGASLAAAPGTAASVGSADAVSAAVLSTATGCSGASVSAPGDTSDVAGASCAPRRQTERRSSVSEKSVSRGRVCQKSVAECGSAERTTVPLAALPPQHLHVDALIRLWERKDKAPKEKKY